MRTTASIERVRRIPQSIKLRDGLILLSSVLLQIALGLLFGHDYDMRIFMATGYLVGTGQNPYVPQDLSAVFHSSAFQGLTSIGYPPPSALVLGLIYRVVNVLSPGLLAYNLAIKLPVITANIALAYLVANILRKMGVDARRSRKAWVFILLNPMLLYFGSAWGQFDSIVALLALLGLVFLYTGPVEASAALLALSVAFKPTAFPILPVALVYLIGKGRWQPFRYLALFSVSLVGFTILPFILLHWDPAIILKHWNAHFTVGGGMSIMTFLELVRNSYQLPGLWWLIGLLWIPALLVGIFTLQPGQTGFKDLLRGSTAMILIFFLTRAWLSEQNIVLLLPFITLLVFTGELPGPALAAIWILPLVFTVFNTSPPQLLSLNFPDLMSRLLKWEDIYRPARLAVRTLLVIPWQFAGWWIVVACLKKRPVLASNASLRRSGYRLEGLLPWK